MTGLSLLTEREGACQSAADSYAEIGQKCTACPFSSGLIQSDKMDGERIAIGLFLAARMADGCQPTHLR